MEANEIGDGKALAKKRKWSDLEEATLIQSVVEREGGLFGDFKGVGSKKKSVSRREGWDDVCGVLNSQYPTAEREIEEVKKKYFNLKQRAKEKIDSIKRSIRKTGGGPAPPTLTPGEEAMAKSLEGRPVSSGIPDGIDTDALSCSGCKETEDGSPVVQSNVPEKQKKENQEGHHVIQKLKS
nr:uncharacterized protein LOC105330658 [Crassostrea gigas]